jgi:hypothetical protein
VSEKLLIGIGVLMAIGVIYAVVNAGSTSTTLASRNAPPPPPPPGSNTDVGANIGAGVGGFLSNLHLGGGRTGGGADTGGPLGKSGFTKTASSRA